MKVGRVEEMQIGKGSFGFSFWSSFWRNFVNMLVDSLWKASLYVRKKMAGPNQNAPESSRRCVM